MMLYNGHFFFVAIQALLYAHSQMFIYSSREIYIWKFSMEWLVRLPHQSVQWYIFKYSIVSITAKLKEKIHLGCRKYKTKRNATSEIDASKPAATWVMNAGIYIQQNHENPENILMYTFLCGIIVNNQPENQHLKTLSQLVLQMSPQACRFLFTIF